MKNLPIRFRLAALLLVAAQLSCGGDGPSAPPPVATTITASTPASLSGTAGAAVTTPPAVLVRDQNGNAMAGVPVAFSVTTGGGSVTGGAAVTNSAGIATVGSWTLGTTAGPNTLTASTGSLTPVIFTATGAAGAAASVTKVAATDAQTAPAGSAVPNPPSVTVRDANGNAVSGANVTFAVTAGGGSVTGAARTTDASGVATVGSWTLGPSAGANSLSATVGSLAPAVFTATATAGAAASITKTAGDNQTAPNGTAVPIPPSVTVRDANGNPVPGVTVVFAIGVGGGTLTGGTQTTNASGVATVGSWTLGPAIGTNTLTATATGLPGVTFTATSTARAACGLRTAHTIGTSTSGDLATTDCLLSDGSYVDYFSTTATPAGSYVFTQTSPTFDTFLLLFGPDNFILGLNDDDVVGLNSRIRVLIPAADLTIGATSFDAATTGAYTISSTRETSSNVTGCEEVFIARGVSTDQSLETTDCVFSGFYSDDILIFLRAGQQVTISMNSAAFDTQLELWSSNGLVASNNNRDGTTTNSQIVYTAPANSFFLIVPSSFVAGTTGAYTLIVQ